MSKSHFIVTNRQHPEPCVGCDQQAEKAIIVATVTGAVGAKHAEQLRAVNGVITYLHSATVQRVQE